MKTKQCVLGKVPTTDDEYFEQMAKAVFKAGMNWKDIENKWSNFREAFHGFSAEEVCTFSEPEIDRLLDDQGIVRNKRKIFATIDNAKEILKVRDEWGSFGTYIQQLASAGERQMCTSLSKRFSMLGESTGLFFLRSVGFEMPETIARKQNGG